MPRFLPQLVDKHQKFDLADVSPNPPEGIDKEGAQPLIEEAGRRLERLFDLAFFASERGILIILQGMDTAGKDGLIRHLLKYSHAQNCRVAAFKVPTAEELAHDFLWRIHKQTPGRGETVIFNRSHYEDVGVVRVHKLVEEKVWRDRYGQINQFEARLDQADTIILKFYLHIDKEEQEERLRDREQNPDAAWKLSAGDWKEREFWKDYQRAYSDAIGKCASKAAPWHVVPANKKWYRNLCVTNAIVDRLEAYADDWEQALKSMGDARRAELEAYRAAGGKSD